MVPGQDPLPSLRQSSSPPRYRVARWLFLRGLGVVGCVAFLSLAVQVRGLIGARGILPLSQYLETARGALGEGAPWQLPTLFWISSSDAAILTVSLAGLLCSGLLAAGVLEAPAIVGMWAGYLSLAVAGQVFLGFQWDSLLLESLLMGLFWASWSWRPRPLGDRPVGRWLVWLLTFKLMFLSGATKLLSGDGAWRDLSALTFHYQTQPLPSWISWWVFRLPEWFHRASVVGMLAMEIALPLLLLLPWRVRLARRLAAAGFMALQLVIAWTGNYGFFNLLSLVLACSLVDDDVWGRWLPGIAGQMAVPEGGGRRRPWVAVAAGCVLAFLSAVAFAAEMQRTAGRRLPDWQSATLAVLSPWRSVNGYGLFRVMTTERPEITIEITDDGEAWRELAFPYKPGDLARRPPIVLCHMPRLDWQMWFAALNPRRAQGWLEPFLVRLLQGESTVWNLLAEPAGSAPPRAVRVVMHRYRFASPAERRAHGRWWERETLGLLGPARTLDGAGELGSAPR